MPYFGAAGIPVFVFGWYLFWGFKTRVGSALFALAEAHTIRSVESASSTTPANHLMVSITI